MTRWVSLAAVAALGAGLAAVPGAAQAASAPDPVARQQRAARSVDVTFNNTTKCVLTLRDKELDHGIWVKHPARTIQPGAGDNFETESDGFMTGTEAAVSYLASNCTQSGKRIRFHWDNPYTGRNSYDWDQTDQVFDTYYTGGNGDNATVTATVSAPD
ncbi:aegerolysin family protein [Microbispora sp. NPDC004025]